MPESVQSCVKLSIHLSVQRTTPARTATATVLFSHGYSNKIAGANLK